MSLKDASAKWSCLFLFENTCSRCWAENGLKIKVHHVVVDRICWDLKPDDKQKERNHGTAPTDDAGKVFPERECVCEKDYSSFQWSKANTQFQSIDGQSKMLVGFCPEDRFEAVDNIKLVALKKRALVNATHAILGILCCRLLAEGKMRPEKQYLAPLHALLKSKRPEWDNALDNYMRMRSIEMSLEELKGELESDRTDSEQCRMVFAKNYREAERARDRFFNTADFLERLMSNERFQKELDKYNEHIVEPFRDYEQNRDKIEKLFGFQQPDRVEINLLKDFLNDSFLQANRYYSNAGPNLWNECQCAIDWVKNRTQ